MTDRVNAFIVTLDRDVREDDAKATLDAIKQIKYVSDVSPHIRDITDHIAYIRVKTKILSNLVELFSEE